LFTGRCIETVILLLLPCVFGRGVFTGPFPSSALTIHVTILCGVSQSCLATAGILPENDSFDPYLFIYLFNNVINTSDYIALNCAVISE
jgi:hypothetical protein